MADEQRVDLRHRAIVATACLRIDSAQKYGFVRGGPRVDVAACEAAIAAAREAGETWSEADVELAIREEIALSP